MTNKVLSFIIALFVIGECVQTTRPFWWSYKNWTIIGITDGRYIIYDGEWTVHSVPEHLLRKCPND